MSELYEFIGEHQKEFSVSMMCEVFGIARSGFCRYDSGRRSVRSLTDEQLGRKIESIFRHHRRRYGARRIRKQLGREGIVCGLGRVRRLMGARQLEPLRRKGFVPKTTQSAAGTAAFGNLLLDYGPVSAINEVWVGDITYIPLREGWAYLAMLLDLCSRRIIAWNLSGHLRAELVVAVLRSAITLRGKHPGLILHTDQGSQYASGACRRLAASHGIRQSMSRRANCYDNAFMESCFATIKCEMLEDGVFENFEDARVELFDYIEAYYNRERLHSSIGYQTPEAYELARFA